MSVLLLIGIWLVALLLVVYYLSRVPVPGLLQWRHTVTEHLSAEGRSRVMLRDLLSEHEYEQLTKSGYLEVKSPSNSERTYRIPGAGGLVRVYEHDTPIMELCLQPTEPLPEGDVIVLHKLMIQGNEQEYLAKANHFAPGIITLRYHL
ncbi:MAG TPA: hypothetical protein VGN32_04400 [Ktedonobacterales bacterium]|nr:hypothetical protein [Ktedonobacterales bacterium]